MQNQINSIEEYLQSLSIERRLIIDRLRTIISDNLPYGFKEQLAYNMISYVVPLNRYPKGYHVTKDQPLPFISLASQKNHIALYHMGIYGNKELEGWFVEEYKQRMSTKLDMGKSCIRFKNVNTIPYELIAELCRKMSVEEYIKIYEHSLNR